MATRTHLLSLPWTSSSDPCPICLDTPFTKFHTSTPSNLPLHTLPFNAWLPDLPVRLPCTHIFGIDCITTWLQLHATCPLCRASPIVTPQRRSVQDFLAAYKALGGVGNARMPIRVFLKTEWGRRSEVVVGDEVRGIHLVMGNAAGFFFQIAVRLVYGTRYTDERLRREWEFPSVSFPIERNDAENFTAWVQAYVPVFGHANDVASASWLEDVKRMLCNSLAGEFFSCIARVFKECNDAQRRGFAEGKVRHTYHPQMLLDRMVMEFMRVVWKGLYSRKVDGDTMLEVWEGKLYRVVKLAARATVEMERRVSELMVEQEKEMGVWGFRDAGGRGCFGGGMR